MGLEQWHIKVGYTVTLTCIQGVWLTPGIFEHTWTVVCYGHTCQDQMGILHEAGFGLAKNDDDQGLNCIMINWCHFTHYSCHMMTHDVIWCHMMTRWGIQLCGEPACLSLYKPPPDTHSQVIIVPHTLYEPWELGRYQTSPRKISSAEWTHPQ